MEDEVLRDDVEPVDAARRRLRALETVAKLRKLPVIGPILTDKELYDEDGLPK